MNDYLLAFLNSIILLICLTISKSVKRITTNINQYLNSEYIHNFSESTKSNIIEEDICIDTQSICDNEKCIGYTRSEIEENSYICNLYTKSKIRLITYDEYNYLYNKLDKNIIGNNYWILNTYIDNKGSLIDDNHEIFINEELYIEHNIKPVISLSKLD